MKKDYNRGIVPQKFGCPQCGNRNMDSLIINDDNDYCICHECGLVYDPISQEVKQKTEITIGYDQNNYPK